MSEENILTWNFPNWVSVILMFAAGYSVLILGTNFIRNRRAA
jgi:hypothetical protein